MSHYLPLSSRFRFLLGKSLRLVSHPTQWLKVGKHLGQFVTVLTLSKDVGIALKDHWWSRLWVTEYYHILGGD
jgi:hypothetical protein